MAAVDRIGFEGDFAFPPVSVVTPVYNGARYLAECIESVAAQRYAALEHVIVDNASTDDSRAIAESYAARYPHIRVVGCAEHFPVIANWNRALGFIADQSRYVWVLPADDFLMGQSLTRMVSVGLRHPTIGIISSLRLRGNRIQCSGLPQDQEVFNGRSIVQMFLREEVFAFSPTGCLIRRDLIDARKPFYPNRYLHADVAAFFDVLDQVDFGFVHDVMMFSREHDGSVTSTIANRKGTEFRDRLFMLQEFGLRYFDPEELAAIEAKFLRRYYRFLVRSAVLMREQKLFRYHLEALRQAERSPSPAALARATLGEFRFMMLRPSRAIEHVSARLQQQAPTDPLWDDPKPG